MTDQPSTQLYFVVGLLAALVLVPLVALAATTSPAAVQDGATFNATSGPEVTAGEDMNVATNNVFPNSETVRLGPVTVSHAGQLAVNLTGADTSLPTIRPQASSSSDLTLAHDNTSLSAAVTGGSVDSLSLSDAATVGDSTRDIEIDTGGTGTTLTVSGLSGSQVTFVDTSGSQNQQLATKSVSGATASLSVAANEQRDILLAPSGAAFGVSLDSTNGPVVEGDNLTATATVNNSGGVRATQSITLDAGPLGTNSTNVTLASGATQTVTLSLPTTAGDAGTVTAQVSSDDDSASASVLVQKNAPNFRIANLTTNAPIPAGGVLDAVLEVRNTGPQDGTQTVAIEGNGDTVTSASLSLPSGATQTQTFAVDTSQQAVPAGVRITTANDSVGLTVTEQAWTRFSERARFAAGDDNVLAGDVVYTPAGDRFAAGFAGSGGQNPVLIDPRTADVLSTLPTGGAELSFSPDGSQLAIGTGKIFDLEQQQVVETFSAGGPVAWSPGGEYIAFGGGTVTVRDADTLQVLNEDTQFSPDTLAWAQDGSRLVAGNGSAVRVYSYPNLVEQTTATLGGSVAVSPNGARVAGERNGNISILDAATGVETQTIVTQADAAGPLAWSPDGDRIATVGPGGIFNGDPPPGPSVSVYLTDSGTREQVLTAGSVGYLGNSLEGVSWGPDGDRLTVAVTGQKGTTGFTERAAGFFTFTTEEQVTGSVTDGSGAAVTNATVTLAQNGTIIDSVETAGNGGYLTIAPDPGEYTLTARSVAADNSSGIIDRKAITVPEGGTTVPFTIPRVQQGVAGTVVDSQGNTISSATVTAGGTTVDATATGRFLVPTINGSVTVTADAPDFGSNSTTVTVLDGQVTGGVVLQLEQTTGFPVTGTVQTPGGDAIEGADVFIDGQATQTGPSGGYSLGVPTTGNVTVTAATAVDSATTVVNVTTTGATADFTLNDATDGGGDGSDPPPGNLEIRFENTGELVNNRTVTVRFFDDSEQRLATRNTTTGIVDLGGVNEEPPLVAVAEADGLFTRRIVLEDLSGDTLFLLDEDKADNQVVINEFDIVDNTGQFSNDVRFRIKRATPLPGETDNIPLRVIGEDLLGADGRFGIALESDVRYRIQIENSEGDVRDLGPHFAVSEGPVRIEIGEVSFDRPDGETFRVDASLESLEGDTDAEQLNFAFVDAGRLTDSVALEIYERSNESNVLVDETFSPETGDAFGAFLFSETLTGNQTGKTWVVEYSADRNETQDGLFTVSATGGSLGIPLDQGIQQVLGVGMVIVIAGLFSTRNAAVGAIVVPLAAGTLWFLGFLSGATTGAAVALALTLGVAYNFATGGV